MTSPSTMSNPLTGCRILVVEDEYFLADDLRRELTTLGADVVGPVGDLEEATKLISVNGAVDAAILDINLRNELIFPWARTLRTRNVPFIFTSGYDRSSIDAEFEDVSLCEKPLDIPAIARELVQLIKAANARALRP
jgi:DNA-binding response OmpR family regulator